MHIGLSKVGWGRNEGGRVPVIPRTPRPCRLSQLFLCCHAGGDTATFFPTPSVILKKKNTQNIKLNQNQKQNPTVAASPPFVRTFPAAGCTAEGQKAVFSVAFFLISPHFTSLSLIPPTPKPPDNLCSHRCHFHSVICQPHLGNFPANCITLFGQLAYKLIFLYK